MASPLRVYELGLVCSQTQLCHIGVFNDYIGQLHVSPFTVYIQVVMREQPENPTICIARAWIRDLYITGLSCTNLKFKDKLMLVWMRASRLSGS